MKILFYSNECKYCNELISKIKETELINQFTLININESEIPETIKVVPTIIDSEYKDLLEGKKAFEYIFNNKYFNNKTNNLYLWFNKELAKPTIDENELALSSEINQEFTNKNTKSSSLYEEFNQKEVKSEETKSEETTKLEKSEKKLVKINNNSILRLRSRR